MEDRFELSADDRWILQKVVEGFASSSWNRDDIHQETMIAIWQARQKDPDIDRPLLRSIVQYDVIDALRASNREVRRKDKGPSIYVQSLDATHEDGEPVYELAVDFDGADVESREGIEEIRRIARETIGDRADELLDALMDSERYLDAPINTVADSWGLCATRVCQLLQEIRVALLDEYVDGDRFRPRVNTTLCSYDGCARPRHTSSRDNLCRTHHFAARRRLAEREQEAALP